MTEKPTNQLVSFSPIDYKEVLTGFSWQNFFYWKTLEIRYFSFPCLIASQGRFLGFRRYNVGTAKMTVCGMVWMPEEFVPEMMTTWVGFGGFGNF